MIARCGFSWLRIGGCGKVHYCEYGIEHSRSIKVRHVKVTYQPLFQIVLQSFSRLFTYRKWVRVSTNDLSQCFSSFRQSRTTS
jgi:hypothetical protein